tara:strand:+ start:708 stop:5615 length:4908 start_codon:yes stop_codon:yes gene_type:complete
MATQALTIDTSDLVGGVPLKPEVSSQETNQTLKTDTISTIDTSDLVGGVGIDTIGKSEKELEEPSTWEKLEYGFDKETWVAGDALRIARAKLQDVFDPNKTFKDYILENEAERKADFEKEHAKFLSGKYDGKYTTIGSAASWLSDPYYLTGYFFGRPLLASPVTSMALNAGLIGGGNIVNQLARKGEVDWVEAGASAGTGAAIGLVFPIGANIVKKYLPSATKNEANKIAKWIDGKLANSNKLSDDELIRLRKISNTDPVKKVTKELDQWATNYYAPISKEFNKLNQLKKDVYNQTKAIRNSNKWLRDVVKDKTQTIINPRDALKMRKSGVQQIVELRNNLQASRKAFEKEKARLVTRQSEKLLRYYQLEGKRTAKIIEQIQLTDNFAQKAYKALMVNITKPLMGGAVGAGGNILFGEEEDFWKFVAAGAFFGATQKAIQGSKKFQIGDKQKIYKFIDSDAAKFTLQKVRELTSGTSYTKLKSFGGATERFSRLFFRGVDDPLQDKSVAAQADAMERYFLRKLDDMVGDATQVEQAQAIAIARGNIELPKTASAKVKKLSVDIKDYLDEFKTLYNQSGFFSPKNIDDYFPRQLNWDKIDADEKFATKVITKIYEDLGIKGRITNKFLSDKVTPNPNYNRLKAEVAAENYLKGHKNGYNSVINANAWKDLVADSNYKTAQRKLSEKELIYTPVSDHIIHQRTLNGPYKIVEEVLEKNGFLINDVRDTLGKVVTDSVKSVAFARKFGKNGELLKPLVQEIRGKYAKANLTDAQKAQGVREESDLIIKSIDAYFDRYGAAGRNQLKASVGIVSMLANLNMLGRVTISSLGDLIQPWQLSANWTSAIKGLTRTNLRAAAEKGPARNLNLDITDEMSKAVARSAGLEGNNVLLSNSWVSNFAKKDKIALTNNLAFKLLGLQWLTGYARRFAYNAGTIDAQMLSRSYFNAVNKSGKNSNAALNLQEKLKRMYNIEANQALQIGKFKNYDDAIKDSVSKNYLNKAGINGANRDALIPQVDNRLLFTQSQTPWIRILGQFLSWTQAKSAQTNRLLSRIENGDAKALIKTLAVIPIYGGIQQLRELAKYGEVITDPSKNSAEFLAKAGQLSGLQGWIVDMFFNRTIGPGGRDPWFLFAPGFQILSQPVVAAKQIYKGDTDAAMKTISRRFVPFPEWRDWIMRLWNPPKVGKLTDKSFKIPMSVGGAVAKAVSKSAINRAKTAITTTKGTYTKTNKIFDDFKIQKVHDFGSGKGVGSKEFKNKIVTSHEPFVKSEDIVKAKGKLPDYKTADEVILKDGLKSKDGIVNLNVLNVIENPSERIKVVDQIGKLLSDDGIAIITTRGDDVVNQAKKSKNAKKYLDGWLFGNKEKTFQKGFKQSELEDFVQKVLGINFKVERIPSKYGIGTSGVLISRLKEIKKFSMGGEVIDTSDLIGGVDSEFPVKKVSSDSVAENMYVKELVEDDSYVDRDDEKKKDIQKIEKLPVYEDNKFLNYMKKVENQKLMLGNKNMMQHKSAEGGTDTVAYGHKLTKEEIETGKIYEYDINKLTVPQANDILKRDLKAAHDKLIEIYGDEYLKLDNRKKQMLIDFQFNMGSGGVKKFKEFRKGLFSGNEEKMKAEYERSYTKDGESFKLEGRNKDFFNFFFK